MNGCMATACSRDVRVQFIKLMRFRRFIASSAIIDQVPRTLSTARRNRNRDRHKLPHSAISREIQQNAARICDQC